MGKTRASKRKRKNDEEDKEKQEAEKKSTKPTKHKVVPNTNKSPVVVFAHGAAAPSTSDWMIRNIHLFFRLVENLSLMVKCRWRDLLAKELNAVEVVTFDYPYISSGKKRAPPKAEKLIDYHSDIIRKAVTEYPGHPLILVGKSMGSRVSCMVAGGDDILASAVVCLGYPLKGAKGAIRDDTLLQLKVPIMFVQGSKDALCPLDKLEAVREKMTSVSELYVIEGGDHSFKIGKKHLQSEGSSQEEAEACAANAISKFVSRLIEGR